MILYFDNLIIDAPLQRKDFYQGLEAIRNSGSNYRNQSRLKISMYTLASYAVLKWDGVLIKYECADANQNKVFEEFARNLFPTAIILRGRSDSQKKFRESLDILNSMPGDWVFVAGNNDHPIIAPTLDPVRDCLAAGEALATENEFVSILYSHLVEYKSAANPQYTIGWYATGVPGRLNWSRLADTEDYLVVKGRAAHAISVQIMHKRMLSRLITGKDYGSQLIRRTDDMDGRLIRNHVMVISKRIMGDHYDGYAHERKMGHFLPYEVYPPLFIPPGFFESEIRIAYGFTETRIGWVNINPSAKMYSFQDTTQGTDLKWSLDRLPVFWRSRTKEVDVNHNVDLRVLQNHSVVAFERMNHPWPKVPAVFSLSLATYDWWQHFSLLRLVHRLILRYLPFLRPLYRMLTGRRLWK